jgi:hypothetical protein
LEVWSREDFGTRVSLVLPKSEPQLEIISGIGD